MSKNYTTKDWGGALILAFKAAIYSLHSDGSFSWYFCKCFCRWWLLYPEFVVKVITFHQEEGTSSPATDAHTLRSAMFRNWLQVLPVLVLIIVCTKLVAVLVMSQDDHEETWPLSNSTPNSHLPPSSRDWSQTLATFLSTLSMVSKS